MDSMGVDVACVFPTPMLGLGLNPVIQAEVQFARAYNRWLTENIMSVEPRMVSMLYLPMNDPNAAMKMVEDFGDKKGVIGFLITTARYKPLYDNCYMKLYSMLEERGLPIGFHSATNWGDQSMNISNKFIAIHALGFSWFNVLHCTNWVVNGIPERFPKLKVIWIESGLAWIPFVMQRLDNEYMMRSSEAPTLKRLPSDYMREMYYTTQPMEMVNNHSMLQETFKMINAENQLLYASDYPHWDADMPSTVYDLPFLSLQAKKNILGESARKLFKLDYLISAEKKARLAARAAAVAAE
jgi:predicted TIM-barrel fold metal-dependent hydrolase